MSRIFHFFIVIVTVLARPQNVTVEIGEVTCGNDDYLDNLMLQVWDKDIIKDDMLGEMYFNVTRPPRNISFVAHEDEILTMSPYLMFRHTCNGSCIRSRLNIPSEYVGKVYKTEQVDLNSTKFDATEPC